MMLIMMFLPCVTGLAASDLAPQEIWPGTVPLGSLTSFHVLYQFFGKDPVVLPPAQYGDEDVGATYQPRGTNIFMHPAWRRGAGWTAVEYAIRLPDVRPVWLKFSVGVDPMAVSRSDGVTFVVYVGQYSKRRELWRQHVKAASTEPVSLDLSRYAGREIILGLQVHPGPDKNTAYDWALWFNPRLVVGTKATGRRLAPDVRKRLEYLYRDGLRPYLNDARSAAPSVGPLRVRTDLRSAGSKRWRFVVRSEPRAGWDVVYEFDFSDGRLDGLKVTGPDGLTWQPCRGGGIQMTLDGRTYGPGDRGVKRELVDLRRRGDAVMAQYKYTAGGRSVTWELSVRLDGPRLELRATAPESSQGISGFSWGRPYGFRLGRAIEVPYLYWGNIWQVGDGFLAAVPDLWDSNASTPGRSRMVYRTRTDGRYNALRERLWIAYVPLLEMALHNIPHPRSPYLQDMASRPVIDIWGGTFAKIEARLRELAGYGVDHTFIIIHNWQRAGYDVQYPDVVPANKGLGGDEGLRRLCHTANGIGHRIAVHENYVDFYPDAPSFNEADVALDPAGKWVKAWLHPSTHIQSFLLKPLRALKYARRFAPDIHRRYGTSGAYLDVHTAAGPWHKVDYDARMPDAGKYLQTWRAYRELFQFMREAHGGPLTGEGANHAFWSGLFDGAEAQVVGGENVQPIVAYDLLKVHQLNVNHGMGYWSRWTAPQPDRPIGARIVLPGLEDKYRAQELTFGHAGFIGTERLGTDRLAVREFYLTRWVQPLAAGAAVQRVEFEVGGRMVPLSEALLAMAPLERIHIVYDSGLELWVNWGRRPWQVAGYTLPQWGYLARASGERLLQYCAVRDGVIADFMQSPEAIFADARPADADTAAAFFFNVRPRIEDFQDLGGGKFRLTYVWEVHGTTHRDLHVFVHFTRPEVPGVEHIAFQNDHAAPKPTSKWRPGEVIRDGPYTVTIPEPYRAPGRIGIRLGLFDEAGRVALGLTMTQRTRCHIGDIVVEKDGDRIRLRYEPNKLAPVDPAAVDRMVTGRLNRQGKTIDFGPVVTDGTVVLRRRGDKIAVIVVPKGRATKVGVRPAKLPAAWRSLKLAGPLVRREGDVLWLQPK